MDCTILLNNFQYLILSLLWDEPDQAPVVGAINGHKTTYKPDVLYFLEC